MRIAHFGTFDVDNYGDLLFPHIAEWRLPFAKILHVSPAGGSTVFRDSLPAVTMAEVSDQKPDAVIVGGGNIVHLRANTLREYREISTLAYPSLSVGAAELAEKNNVPLIFNGPSIPITHLNLVERRFLGRAIRNASCLAVRDAVSLTLAESLGAEHGRQIPDTAFDVSRMWPVEKPVLTDHDKGYVAVHVNSRYGGDAETVAASLDAFAGKTGLGVHFLPIGPCHGDMEHMRSVASKMQRPHACVDDMSLKGFAREIAQADIYVGSSMHGFITALSYDVPALLVLGDLRMHKFMGVLQAAEVPETVILQGWADLPDHSDRACRMTTDARNRITEALNAHWQRVSDIIARPNPGAKPETLMGWRAGIALSILVKQLRQRLGGHRPKTAPG